MKADSMGPDAKYKIVITPSSASTSVWQQERCIYSVSIGAADKTVDDLVAALLWTKSRFSDVTILIGDSLYALTLQIQRGCNESDAEAQAVVAAEAIVAALHRVAPGLELLRTSQLSSEPQFLSVETGIKDAFFTTPAFAGSVEADARAFVRRQRKNNRLALAVPLAESLARHYLIRETAIYAYLASRGWLVDAYLGQELPTLARIMEGSVPAVSPHLRRRINISLRPKELW